MRLYFFVKTTLARDLEISRNTLPDYIDYLEKSGLFNSLKEKSNGDGITFEVGGKNKTGKQLRKIPQEIRADFAAGFNLYEFQTRASGISR